MSCKVCSFLVLIIYSQRILSESNTINNIEMVQLTIKFLSKQVSRNDVVFAVCWNNYEYIKYTKLFNKHGYYTTGFDSSFKFKTLRDRTVILDFQCNRSKYILETMNNFDPFTSWLIFNHDENYDNLCDSDIGVDSKLYLIINNGTNKYKIKSPYKVFKDSPTIITNDIAVWYQNNFEYFNVLSDVENRTNLMGMDMNISYVVLNLNTLNHLTDYRDKHIDTITKYNYMLSNYLAESINITQRFIMQRSWGYLIPNSSMYNGMMGDLQSGLAEIGGTPAFFTADRVPIVQYVSRTTPTRAKFIFKAPPLSYVANVFTMPFRASVWYAIFGLLVVIVITVHLITSSEYRLVTGKAAQSQQKVPEPIVADSVQLMIGAVCQQGAERDVTGVAARIATLFVFLTFLFLYTSYSANIVALLQSTTDSIRTLDDLLSSRIVLGAEDTPYTRHFFPLQNEKVRKAIYLEKIAGKGDKDGNYYEAKHGMARVQNDFFALHVESSVGYTIVGDTFQENEKCSIVDIEYLEIIDPWFTIRKHSKYSEILKSQLRKMQERGVEKREYGKLYTKKPDCATKGGNFVSVGLIDCYSVFMTFLTGIGLAVLTFIVEKIAYKRFCIEQRKSNGDFHKK